MSVSSQKSFRSRVGSVLSLGRKSSYDSVTAKEVPEGGSLVSSNREPYVPRYAAKGFLCSTGGDSPTSTPASERDHYISEPSSPVSA